MGARKPTPRSEIVLFNVLYEDGLLTSNRKVPGSVLGGLEKDAPPENGPFSYAGLIHGLTRYYKLTGYKPALELAGRFGRYMKDHSGFYDAQGHAGPDRRHRQTSRRRQPARREPEAAGPATQGPARAIRAQASQAQAVQQEHHLAAEPRSPRR